MFPQPRRVSLSSINKTYIGVSLDQPLWVTVYDPLRRVLVAELEVIKSKEKLRHG